MFKEKLDVKKCDLTVAAKIKTCRKQSNLTQQQLANRISVSMGTVRRWEHNENIPNDINRKALEDIFGLVYGCLAPGKELQKHKDTKKVEPPKTGRVQKVTSSKKVESKEEEKTLIGIYKPKNAIEPNHYRKNLDDLIESWFRRYPLNEFRAIMKANIERYTFRFDQKNGEEDLQKAQQFLKRLLEYEKRVKKNDNL